MTENIFWNFCEDMQCQHLFNDECLEKSTCKALQEAKKNISIFMIDENDNPRFVASMKRKLH